MTQGDDTGDERVVDEDVAGDDGPAELLRPIEPEPVAEPAPVVAPSSSGWRSRLGGFGRLDRRQAVYGAATATVLAVAGVFGLQLVRALAGDEATGSTDPVSGPVGALVPRVVALAAPPARVDAPEVLAALNAGRHDVAVDTTVGALCATVGTSESLTVAGRWERDGEEVASTEVSAVGAPGFADCIAAGGDPMPDGVYQFVVVDDDGATSAPGMIVLGAAVVSQSFVNDADEPICGLRLAPLRAGYFEYFDASATPIAPGGAVTVPMAAVRQRLEAIGCDDGATIASAQVRPDAGSARAIGG